MPTTQTPSSSPITADREHLVRALTADLIGPYDLDHPAAEEVLTLPPSRWYLTGFLAPDKGREIDDPTEDDVLGAGDDADEEETAGQEHEPKRKKRLPASMGLSVLLPPGSEGKTLDDPAAVSAALANLPRAYGAWIEKQAPPLSTRKSASRPAMSSCARPGARGIASPLASRCSRTTPWRSTPSASPTGRWRRPPGDATRSATRRGGVPTWRLFQLAFVLLNLRGIVP